MSPARRFTLKNGTTTDLRFTLEPWADQYVVGPGRSVELVVEGNLEGCLEFEHLSDGLVVYGYTGCLVSVWSDGSEVEPSDQL